MSLWSKIFGGKPKRVSTLSPGQEQIRKMILEGIMGQGQTAGLYSTDPEQITGLFEKGVADPARRNFQERTLPALAQRAAASGASRSSGLQRQFSQSESDLEQQLQEMLARSQLGFMEGAQNRQQRGIETLLGVPESQMVQGNQGWLSQIAQIAAPFVGARLGYRR